MERASQFQASAGPFVAHHHVPAQSTAKLLTMNGARRVASNVVQLPTLLVGAQGLENPSRDQAKQDERAQAEKL